jgi:dihydroneopterin triphosphate diphosphatase
MISTMQVRYDMVVCYIARPVAAGGWEFLQLRRCAGDFMGGTWQTISGGIEGDETAWQAAIREIREETGLTPQEFYQIDHVEAFYIASRDTIWHRPGFCAIVPADSLVRLNEEHDDHRWIRREEVDQEFIWPGERTALAEVCREILDNGPTKPYLLISFNQSY